MSYSQFDRIYERLDELESAVEKLEKRLDALDATEAPADVWPDDENHRLGPNGEQLIAVDHVSCKSCFLFGQPCYSQNAVLTCCYDYRKDKRNIHWKLAGECK